ncbi:MAG: sensor domain-containing diguanylate cyclase [bacterium]|nr:sensor domain-containing diguanylate cyclase [bacterium]
MSHSELQSILESARTNGDEQAFIPVHDPAIYFMLIEDVAQTMLQEPAPDFFMAVDGDTARHVNTVGPVHKATAACHVLGKCPTQWKDAGHVVAHDASETLGPHEHLFMVMSSTLNVAFLAIADRSSGFDGAWTGHPGQVREIAKTILERAGASEDLDTVGLPDAQTAVAYPSKLMGMLANRLVADQDDLAVDKHDLLSVLEILKAISARRRSHDVLFVFVEKIARVVDMGRCSVVRIWGDEDTAHVLASHDDERIRDLRLGLDKYPEVRQAVETLGRVIINDVARDDLTRPFADELIAAGVGSLLVIPIVLLDPNVGSLFLRAARGTRPFTQREISFCEIVAEAASNALERAHLFESIQRANERLEFLAITDGLTGLFNHRHFRERLDEEFERARRYDLPLSCIIFDIDDFKMINDTYGHLQGDHILQEIAARTQKFIRRSDLAARYGGEEFVLIMPQTGMEGAAAHAERLLEELNSRPYKGMPPDTPVTVSIGVGVFDRETMLDCEALIRTADSALYEAKRGGKNRVAVGNREGTPS